MYKIDVRNVKPDELPEVVRVEEEAWPEDMRAALEKFQSRMQRFPEGFFGAYVDGRLVGVSTSIVVDYHPGDAHKWVEFTDNGFGRNHDPNANSLYVVSLGVSQQDYMRPVRDYLRTNGIQSLGTLLIERQKRLARELGKQYVLLTARIPGYEGYVEERQRTDPTFGQDLFSKEPVADYLSQTVTRSGITETLDPEIRFYRRCGLDVGMIVPDTEIDKESKNYGVIMHWKVR